MVSDPFGFLIIFASFAGRWSEPWISLSVWVAYLDQAHTGFLPLAELIER
jgi:hypothetical protein